MPTNFVDVVTLHVTAGDGGNGCVSVRREKFKPLAGPDGGRGGNGGSIYLEATSDVTTLLPYHRRPHRRADHGGFGMGDYRQGTDGEDVVLPVPLGTVVRNADGDVIADMQTAGMQVLIAEGGRGGLGNAQLSSPRRKAPGFALLGTKGFAGDIQLELKTVADVALVGFPSAGKSSLIAALSAARPKIADYPFTTLAPNLGVVQAGDIRYTIADVPGLIPGASEGKGLGLEFLRHIERCAAIVHVVDCATLEPNRDPLSDFEQIRHELAAYPVPEGDVPLIDRPQLIALNKIDVPEGRELADFVAESFTEQGFRVFEISSASHAGIRELSFAMAELVAEYRNAQEAQRPALTTIVPQTVTGPPFMIEELTLDGKPAFRVRGRKPERWIEQTDFANDEAVGYLGDRLAKLGVEEALAKHGAHAGDTVVIGAGDDPVVFDWEPTIASIAEAVAPRGTDPRLLGRRRRSNVERRAEYHDWMDAKSAARAELDVEREAGLWQGSEPAGPDVQPEQTREDD